MFEFDHGSSSLSLDNDLNTLWQELDLKGLLNTSAEAITLQKKAGKLSSSAGIGKKKRKTPTALEKVYQKPEFKAIVDRYKTAPKKSGHIPPTNKRIDNLADPIRGRYSGVEKAIGSDDYVISPTKYNVQARNQLQKTKNKKSTAPSFFLTGEDDIDQDDEDEMELNTSHRNINQNRSIQLVNGKASNKGLSSNLVSKIRNSAKTFEENEKKRMYRLNKNTKVNRSKFVDKYLSTKETKKAKSNGVRGRSSGYGQTSKSKKSAAVSVGNKSKTNVQRKPDWSLRPPMSKADAKLLQPLPALSKARVVKQKETSLVRNISRNIRKKEPLRSKSSADMRRDETKENRNPAPLGGNGLRKKPSSTSSLSMRSSQGPGGRVLGESNNSEKSSRLQRGLPSKPATVLSPIKPIPPRPKTPVDKIDEVSRDLKKRVGLTKKKTEPLKKVEIKDSIDTDVKAALSRAEDLSQKNTAESLDNGATAAFGRKVKTISSRLSEVDDMKFKHQLDLE